MKNIKKWLAAALIAALCLSMVGCAAQQTTTLEKLETSAAPAEGEEISAELKDPANYDDDIQGLCKFMEDCKVTAGERVQMEYGVIGAVNGYKYAYTYDGSNVQLEVYEFAQEGLSETAQSVIDSVKTNGSFVLLDNTIPAKISANGRYMLIYTDEKAEKEDSNKAHKQHVLDCFETFTAE